MLRTTITDARARRVPLIRHEVLIPGVLGDRERIARLQAAARAVGSDPPTRSEVVRGIGYSVLCIPVILLTAPIPAFMAFKLHLPMWAMLLVAVPLGLIPACISIFLTRRVMGRRIARQYVRAGYCPSCGYDIRMTEPAGDGCRVCGECGAAWRDPASPSKE